MIIMNGAKETKKRKLISIFFAMYLILLPVTILAGGLHPWCDTVTPVCPNLSTGCHNVAGYYGIKPFGFDYKSYSEVPNMVTKKCIGNTDPDPHCDEDPTYCRTRTYWTQPNCTGSQYPKYEDYSNRTCTMDP